MRSPRGHVFFWATKCENLKKPRTKRSFWGSTMFHLDSLVFVASTRLWGRLQNLSFSNISKRFQNRFAWCPWPLWHSHASANGVENLFVWQAQYFFKVPRRSQKMTCMFPGRRSTLVTSIVILPGTHSTLDVCLVARFLANFIVRAVSSVTTCDNVHIAMQAWDIVSVILRGRGRPVVWTFILHGWRNISDTLRFTPYVPHSTLDTPYSTLHTLHFAPCILYFTLSGPCYTLHTLHSTLHTLHATLRSPHFTLYTLHSTLGTLHSALYTLHSTLYTPHFRLHTVHCRLYALHFTLRTLHSPMQTLHSTLYTLHSTLQLQPLHFTLHTVHSTLHTLHFTLCTSHFALYTLHFTLHFNTLHFALYTPHFTLDTPHFRLYILHSTLHTLHSALHNLLFTRNTPYITHHITLHSTLRNSHFSPYTLHVQLFSRFGSKTIKTLASKNLLLSISCRHIFQWRVGYIFFDLEWSGYFLIRQRGGSKCPGSPLATRIFQTDMTLMFGPDCNLVQLSKIWMHVGFVRDFSMAVLRSFRVMSS